MRGHCCTLLVAKLMFVCRYAMAGTLVGLQVCSIPPLFTVAHGLVSSNTALYSLLALVSQHSSATDPCPSSLSLSLISSAVPLLAECSLLSVDL